MNKKQFLALSTGALITSALLANVTMAAVPNTFTAGTPASAAEVNANFSDLDARSNALDARIALLESSAPTGDKEVVDVDCDTTADYFVDDAFADIAKSNVSYMISGTCDGPVIIKHDDVELIGAEAGAGVTLPAGIDILTNGLGSTILVEGATRVYLSDLTVNASAYSNEGSESGTVGSLRGSYVRLNNITSIGGQYGIAAYNGSFMRLEGTTTITEFVNSGITVGQQSTLFASGPVVLTTTDTSGSYIDAAESFGAGYIEFADDLEVSVLGNQTALFSGNMSYLRVRGGNTVTITGSVLATQNSLLLLTDASVDGDIASVENSNLRLENVVQTDITSGTGFTQLAASRAFFNNVELAGTLQVTSNSTLRMVNGGSIADSVEAASGSFLSFSGVNQAGATGDINSDGADIRIDTAKFNAISMNTASKFKSENSQVAEVNGTGGSALEFYGSTITGGMTLDDNSFGRLSGTTFNAANNGEIALFGSRATIDGSSVINSAISLIDNSTLRMFDSTINNSIGVFSRSFANLQMVVQSGANSTVNLNGGAGATIGESTVGSMDLFAGTDADLFQTTVGDVSINVNSTFILNGSNLQGFIGVFGGSSLNVFPDENGGGNLNGNTIYLCGSQNSYVEGFEPGNPSTSIAATGTVLEFDCPP